MSKKWTDVEKAQWILENAWSEHKLERWYDETQRQHWWKRESAPPWWTKDQLGPFDIPGWIDIEAEIAAALSCEITKAIDEEILKEILKINAQ